jgi:hypothetical protein
VAVGRHAGKECSICSDIKTHNCSGHDIEEQEGGRGEEGERKVWKWTGKTTKGGIISTRRESKGVEAKEKGEDEKQRNVQNKEQKKKGI